MNPTYNEKGERTVLYNGKEVTLLDLSKQSKIHRASLYHRIITLAWPIDKAISTPVKERHVNQDLKVKNRLSRIKPIPVVVSKIIDKTKDNIFLDCEYGNQGDVL